MRGASKHSDSALTVVDANVFVEYYLDFAMDLLGHGDGSGKSRRALVRKKIRNYLDREIPSHSILVTDTVFRETVLQIWEVLGRELRRLTSSKDQIEHICRACTNHFVAMSRGMPCQYDTSLLEAVKRMYKKIWDDPRGVLRKEWVRKKGGAAAPGPPAAGTWPYLPPPRALHATARCTCSRLTATLPCLTGL